MSGRSKKGERRKIRRVRGQRQRKEKCPVAGTQRKTGSSIRMPRSEKTFHNSPHKNKNYICHQNSDGQHYHYMEETVYYKKKGGSGMIQIENLVK